MRAWEFLRLSRAPLASFAALGVLWGSFSADVPDLKAGLALGDGAFGQLYLCSSVAAVLAMAAAPRFGRRLGDLSMPLATVILAAAFQLPGQMAGVWGFALAMVAMGAASGLLDVLMNARVSALESARGIHLMGLNHATFSFAYALGAAATGLARQAGYGPAPILAGASLIAALTALASFERTGGEPSDAQGPASALRRAMGWGPALGGFVILIAFLAENAVEAWSALHIERSLGGSPALGGFGPAILGLTMGFGRLSGQIVAQRVAEGPLLFGAVLTASFGAVAAGLAPNLAIAYLGLTLMGLGVSVVAPVAFAVVGRTAARGQRARAIARATMLGYCGFFFGPPLLGALAQVFGLGAAFLATALLLLALLPVIPVFLRARAPAN
ncbi:MAG: MFS transporter [Paracoccaceae bacterium]